jgi:hypothetical protein
MYNRLWNKSNYILNLIFIELWIKYFFIFKKINTFIFKKINKNIIQF